MAGLDGGHMSERTAPTDGSVYRRWTAALSALAALFLGTTLSWAQNPDRRLDYALVYEGWSVHQFRDAMQVDAPDEPGIGVVDDMVFATNGRLLSVVVRIGGFWETGERLVNVPWQQVVITSNATLTVPIDEEILPTIAVNDNAVLDRDEAETLLVIAGNEVTPEVWRASQVFGVPTNLIDRRAFSRVEDLVILDERVAAILDDDRRALPFQPMPASIRIAFMQIPLTLSQASGLRPFDPDLLAGPFDNLPGP